MPSPAPNSPAASLLIIEDDVTLATLLQEALEKDGFSVRLANDPMQGLATHAMSPADLIILDRMFAEGDGLLTLEALRAGGDGVPVIMLTAKGTLPEKLEGLAGGADDYLAKPFSFLELQARVRALLRRSARSAAPSEDLLKWGPEFTVDRTLMRVYREGQDLDVTPQEFRLLSLLVAFAGRPLSRTELLNLAWPPTSRPANVRTVDVYMARLRGKLGSRNGEPLILTVGGEGYLWASSPAAKAVEG